MSAPVLNNVRCSKGNLVFGSVSGYSLHNRHSQFPEKRIFLKLIVSYSYCFRIIKALDSQAVSLLISGVNEANKDGANITSIDVSTTTTGKHSSNKSRHYVKNGAKAIDIDMVNNVPVKNSKSREKVNQLQKGIDKTGNAHQNIGPEIQIGVNRHVGGHDNHIHFDAL